MFYKPAYCCHCGEKIESVEKHPWSSGRFCDVCSKEFSFQEWLPKVFILVCVLFGLFGIGSYLKSGEPTNVAALRQNKSFGLETDGNPTQNSNRQIVQKNEPKTESNLTAKTNINPVEKQIRQTEKTEIEQVFFCGAATKKGTPCSRKVKGGGRCWQHKGQEALFAQEKLLITQ